MDPNDIWAMPAPVTKGDAELTTVWAAVGEALSYWEWVEGHLALVFNELVSEKWSAPAHRAYGSIVAFKGRSDLIKSAGEIFFVMNLDEALWDKLKATLNVLGRASPRRNDIAHGIAQPLTGRATDGFALMPGFYATNRRDLAGIAKYAMSSAEIKRFGQQFYDLQAPVKEIGDALAERRMSGRRV